MKGDADDPKALIREAFNIEGITEPECRTVFLDWALGIPMDQDTQLVIQRVLEQYKAEPQDHPMITTLKNGLEAMSKPKRRGGWKSRPRP